MATPTDNPISKTTDDRLGRAHAARDFADQVLRLDASDGLVVGVLGPWGAGKTSFVNLARTRFAEDDVALLDFNPWMFSGAAQLVDAFFIEIAAQLRLEGRGRTAIADALNDYGDAFSGMGWVPVVGPWVERGRGAAKLFGKLLARRKEGATGRRQELVAALSKLEQPIVVVLDDIDRLSTSEIRDIFKLVRLTASFPNVTYVVAFDRLRVEQALSEDGIPGRDYLEKILQLAVDLPAVPETVLRQEVGRSLDAMLAEVTEHGSFDAELWPDVFAEVIEPLIRQMRDVRRFVAAAEGTVRSAGVQIALVDVLALEAIRVFLPDVFALMSRASNALTEPSSLRYGGPDSEDDARKQVIAELIAAGGDHAAVVRAMVHRLFPAGSRHLPGGTHYGYDHQATWLRERRVANPEILNLYLSRVVGEGLAAHTRAEALFALIGDEQGFAEALAAIDVVEREDAISALARFDKDYAPEHVVSGARVLLNALAELPERDRGMFSFGPDIAVARVVGRLLRSIDEEVDREKAVEAILAGLLSLSARRELIELGGYEEGNGEKLVSTDAADRFEAQWRDQVRAASAAELAGEPDVLRLLAVVRRGQTEAEPALQVPEDPTLTHALLRGALTRTRRQTLGSRAVRSEPRLRWDTLVAVLGDENTLTRRVEQLRKSSETVDVELLELYDKYASGWRPKPFH